MLERLTWPSLASRATSLLPIYESSEEDATIDRAEDNAPDEVGDPAAEVKVAAMASLLFPAGAAAKVPPGVVPAVPTEVMDLVPDKVPAEGSNFQENLLQESDKKVLEDHACG